MKRKYLGDSYDAVKRLWQEILGPWAPLYADPRFIPEELRADFTRMTRIPIFNGAIRGPLSVLNDPDTGIRLPDRNNQKEGLSHVTLATIRDQLRNPQVRCVLTFDQAKRREKDNPPKAQRDAKRLWLTRHDVESFYYVSHAPFLFAFANRQAHEKVVQLLSAAGIPTGRIEQ